MGVFFYCNKTVKTDNIVKVFETRGHKNIKSVCKCGETIISAGKILTETVSYLDGKQLSSSEDDYIVGIGTYFYDGVFGEEALRKVYDNLDIVLNDNPVYGHWAFVVHKEGTTYVFNDMSGVLRLYVVQCDDQVVVTSSMLAAISSIEKPKFDKIRLSGFFTGNFGAYTPFVDGVENFNSFQYMVVKGRENPRFINRNIPEVERIESMDRAIEYVKSLYELQVRQLKAIENEKISIELTGGLDSRLTSSVLRAAGFNFDFLSYPFFGPDREVAVLISKGLNKKLLLQTNEHIQGDIIDHFGEFDFGFDYLRSYYANPRWNIVNRLQFSGALGECLTTPVSHDYLDDTRIESLLPKLTGGPLIPSSYKDKFVERLVEYFEKRGFKRGVPLNQQELSHFELMLLGQLTGDYMFNAGCQAHIYFYNMFVEWHFSHFVSNISFDIKNGRKLSIALIKSIDPELASYPFVSRRRTKRKSVNSVNELPLHYFSYNGIKDVLPKGVVDFIYEHMGRSFNKERFASIDFGVYEDVVDVRELKKHRNLYSNTLNRMFSIEILRKLYNIE